MLILLLGSMASTASFRPSAIRCIPKDSMKVLLPTPGTPVMPMRSDFPEYGSISSISCAASTWCCGLVDSTRVIARLSRAISPASMPSFNTCMSGNARLKMLVCRTNIVLIVWGGIWFLPSSYPVPSILSGSPLRGPLLYAGSCRPGIKYAPG
ncbi:hypothetical protein D3C80_1538860 [compost metagenome]